MRFTALALLATAHALTPSRKIKVARMNTLDSSVTFDEYVTRVKSSPPIARIPRDAVDANEPAKAPRQQ